MVLVRLHQIKPGTPQWPEFTVAMVGPVFVRGFFMFRLLFWDVESKNSNARYGCAHSNFS